MMTTTELVPAANIRALNSLDAAAREKAVTKMLHEARGWLVHAVAATTPLEEVAHFRTVMATVAEATQQLQLSQSIQDDATEMTRRAERALGIAIRRGQEDETVLSRGERRVPANQYGPTPARADRGDCENTKLSPLDFARPHELTSMYRFAQANDAEFDEALATAREEGRASRANVERLVRGGERRPRRKPLPDTARDAAWAARSIAEKVERILDDPRYPANRVQVDQALSIHLRYVLTVCERVLSGAIDTDKEEVA